MLSILVLASSNNIYSPEQIGGRGHDQSPRRQGHRIIEEGRRSYPRVQGPSWRVPKDRADPSYGDRFSPICGEPLENFVVPMLAIDLRETFIYTSFCRKNNILLKNDSLNRNYADLEGRSRDDTNDFEVKSV